jgi:hypothetical protein
MVGVDLALRPGRWIEAARLERPQRGLLDRESPDRLLVERAVDALPGDLGRPADRFALDVGHVVPVLAPEEALADVLHLAFDVGFARRMADDGGIDHEAAVRGVFLERALEDGIVPIGLRDGGAKIVQDHAGRDAAEVLPGVLEPLDQVRELLRGRGGDVLVAAVDERDNEGVEDAPPPRLRVGHEAELPEVHLRELARRDLGHAHRDALPLVETAVLDREPVQRAVWDLDAEASEELVGFGETQASAAIGRREPRAELLLVRREQRFTVAVSGLSPDRLEGPRDLERHRLVGLGPRRVPTEPTRALHIAADGLPAAPRRPLDRGSRLSAVNPSEDIQDLPHFHLPIRHPRTSSVRSVAGDGLGSGLRSSREGVGHPS